MTSGEQSEESFDPAQSVMVSSQKTEDISSHPHARGRRARNRFESSGFEPANGFRRHLDHFAEDREHQLSIQPHTVKRTVLPQGTVKRLSVSVLLDQEVRFEGTGAKAKRVLEPPTPERLKVIHDLVAAAAGFDAERGDQLIVESLPFESTLNLEPPSSFTPLENDSRKKTPLEQFKSDPKSDRSLWRDSRRGVERRILRVVSKVERIEAAANRRHHASGAAPADRGRREIASGTGFIHALRRSFGRRGHSRSGAGAGQN